MRDHGDENDFPGYPDALQRANMDQLDFVKPHLNLHPTLNNAIAESALQGGAWLKDLAVGRALRITTQNSVYTLRKLANETGDGVNTYGPDTYRLEQTKHTEGQYKLKDGENPIIVRVHGSTWGGSMIKVGFVGRGMHLEMGLPSKYGPNGRRTLTTSAIQEVEEIS